MGMSRHFYTVRVGLKLKNLKSFFQMSVSSSQPSSSETPTHHFKDFIKD